MVARGQALPLPPGKFNRVYLLAASAGGDQQATFRIGEQPVELTIQDWGGFIGQWDNRSWKPVEMPVPAEATPGDTSWTARQWDRIRSWVKEHGPVMVPGYAGLTPGFIKRAPVAWFASHRHSAEGANEPYSYSYLFAYALDVPAGAKTLTLPNNDRVRILAVSVANRAGSVRPAQPLYDTLGPAVPKS